MPPTDRPGPVQPTESVYRRINILYYTRNTELPVSPQAFKPTSDDEFGISVVRTGFTSKPADALCRVGANKLNSYHVASIGGDLLALHVSGGVGQPLRQGPHVIR